MTDKLSYKQLFDRLGALNTQAYNSIHNDDLGAFEGIVEDFMASGITELKNFPIARQCFQFSNTPFTINNLWLGADEKIVNDYIYNCFSMGRNIADIKADTVYPFYVYMTDCFEDIQKNKPIPEPPTKKRKYVTIHDKRLQYFNDYIERYTKLYEPNINVLSNSLIKDDTEYQKIYTNRIKELVDLRRKFFLTFNFSCKTADRNMKLKGMSLKDKISALLNYMPNIYEDEDAQTINKNIKDYLTFDDKEYGIFLQIIWRENI